MFWKPLSREALEALLAGALEHADDAVREVWEAIRIVPERWQCSPWGDAGGGFWAVAERDGCVIWFNDIEGGFNVSRFTRRGVIDTYACNQGNLLDTLLTLPEGRASLEGRYARGGAEVPPALQRPGRILKRQTTYWTLQPEGGNAWRVHFREKKETRWVREAYSTLSLSDSHPALMDHHESWSSLYLAGPAHGADALLRALALRVHLAAGRWRSLKEYLNPAVRLEQGYGLLLEAPESIARQVAEVLHENGVPYSLLPGRPRGEGPFRLLQLGDNFIVARAFRFEELATQSR